MKSFYAPLFVLLTLFNATPAFGMLYSNSLVSCMKNNTNIQPDYFSVTFNPEDRSLTYDISLTAQIEGKLTAYATVYAYGFEIIHKTIDLCSLNLKQFCPITASKMEIESVQYISQEYIDMIPGIAYNFPNIDAVARMIIVNQDTNAVLGCLQATINNGKTVSHEGAKWATACVAGVGLLMSAALSMYGNSASASRLSAAAISLFTYFQSVVIISMIHVIQIPAIAGAWAENLAWSMGLIRITFMQKIFRWYIQATGGVPTQYLTTSATQILTQKRDSTAMTQQSWISKFLNYVWELFVTSPDHTDYRHLNLNSREDDSFISLSQVSSNNYLTVLRGMDRVGYGANIEPTSIVCTAFTFFIIFLYLLVGLYWVFRGFSKIFRNNSNSKVQLKINDDQQWTPTLKGIIARYVFIGFPQLTVFSLWEFTRDDSAAIVTLSVFFLIMALIAMAFCCYKVFHYARKSIDETGNPCFYLYGNQDVLSRYGFLYTMLDARRYWFCAVILIYTFVKALFVSLSQASGKTQAMACWIIDMIYLGVLIHFMPFLDNMTNILYIFISVVNTLNSFFFTFFSEIYNQTTSVAPVMGIIFFILNAATSLILVIVTLVLCVLTLIYKNPDSKFSPAKDDRTSFQKGFAGAEQPKELIQLGMIARDHDQNWRNTIYGEENFEGSDDSDDLKRQLSGTSSRFGKVWGKLSRGLSQKRLNQQDFAEQSDEKLDAIQKDFINTSDDKLPIPETERPTHVTTPSMDSGALNPYNPFKPVGLDRPPTNSGASNPFEKADLSQDSIRDEQPLNQNYYRL